MRNTPRGIITALTLILFVAGSVLAQGFLGLGSSRHRYENKHTAELVQTMNQIDAMNRDPRSGFDRVQAKNVLSIVNPLRRQPKLTDRQAQQALDKLKTVTTTRKAMAWQKNRKTNPTYRPDDSYRPDRTDRPDKSDKDYRPDSQRKSDRPDIQRQIEKTDKNYKPDTQRRPDARSPYRPDYKPEQTKDFNPFFDKKARRDSWQEIEVKRMGDIIDDIERASRGQRLSPLSRRDYQPDRMPSKEGYTPNNSKHNEKYVPSEKAPDKS